mgnify:CR=1 FL=1
MGKKENQAKKQEKGTHEEHLDVYNFKKKERKKETPLGPDQRETEPQGSSFVTKHREKPGAGGYSVLKIKHAAKLKHWDRRGKVF